MIVFVFIFTYLYLYMMLPYISNNVFERNKMFQMFQTTNAGVVDSSGRRAQRPTAAGL